MVFQFRDIDGVVRLPTAEVGPPLVDVLLERIGDEAEKIARENGYGKMAVIAGVGVRGYYKKLGYKLENSYMVKNL